MPIKPVLFESLNQLLEQAPEPVPRDITLTKAILADSLYKRVHGSLPKKVTKQLIELFFEEIRLVLERGECVKLSGFGNFIVRQKDQRPGRNPKTGEEIPVTPRWVVAFRPGQKLKKMTENKDQSENRV
jgi:integration host factor subunit alpha